MCFGSGAPPATTSALVSMLSSMPKGFSTGPSRFQLYSRDTGDPPILNVSMGAGGIPLNAPRLESSVPNPWSKSRQEEENEKGKLHMWKGGHERGQRGFIKSGQRESSRPGGAEEGGGGGVGRGVDALKEPPDFHGQILVFRYTIPEASPQGCTLCTRLSILEAGGGGVVQ